MELFKRLLKGKKDLTAEDARALTKYGKLLRREDLLTHYIYEIEDEIKLKIRDKKFSLSVDITENNSSFIEDIKERFVSLGYKVYALDGSVYPELSDIGIILITW